MTDKKIIIDGVDVVECKFRCYIDRCMANTCITTACKDSPNCYYKQLQRKEQECEELKKYKDVVNKLAGMQIILTNKDKMPELYENAKDLKLDCYKQTLEKIEEFVEPIYEQIPEDRVLRQILLMISEKDKKEKRQGLN